MHKFERLEIWELSIDYVDLCYAISEQLPKREEFNLAAQLRRAATSVALNIAEGSTGQSDAEQARFLGMALRSLIETVACQHLIFRRQYAVDVALLRQAYKASDKLAAKFRPCATHWWDSRNSAKHQRSTRLIQEHHSMSQAAPTENQVVGRPSSVVMIGTRSSKLALVQTHFVRDTLQARWPGLDVGIEHITTKGDIILDRPLSAIGDKGLFVTEIEDAMRAGRVDMAVHSAKDLPSELPPDMTLAVIPAREDPRDALVSLRGAALAALPAGAHVGTSSLRRACQLRAARPDLRITDLRGNVDTRLRKLHEGQYDAIVLAAAGLRRLGLEDEITELLDPTVMLPAVAQGALGIETRAGDAATRDLLAPLEHAPTRSAVEAERAFLARIGGGCQVPIAAYAWLEGATITLSGLIGARDGRVVRGTLAGPVDQPAALGAALAEHLLDRGGLALLNEAP